MNNRIEEAMILADQCWKKANQTAPEFVVKFLEMAEDLLINRPIVMGDEFREHCRRNAVFLPPSLHHNTWVSGVRALNIMGWIEPISKVEPEQRHNHMDSVTLWKSKIFGGKHVPRSPQLGLFNE